MHAQKRFFDFKYFYAMFPKTFMFKNSISKKKKIHFIVKFLFELFVIENITIFKITIFFPPECTNTVYIALNKS